MTMCLARNSVSLLMPRESTAFEWGRMNNGDSAITERKDKKEDIVLSIRKFISQLNRPNLFTIRVYDQTTHFLKDSRPIEHCLLLQTTYKHSDCVWNLSNQISVRRNNTFQ